MTEHQRRAATADRAVPSLEAVFRKTKAFCVSFPNRSRYETGSRQSGYGTVEGLRAALQIDPGNARATAYLGRRLADQALKQGTDPDKARRARGEADFLTSRALKLAPDNDEVKRLRAEVVKLLQIPVESTHGGN
jgi:hypothetical protein